MSKTPIKDGQQLDLFENDLPRDDPVRTLYRKLREIGATLSLDRDTNTVWCQRARRAVPLWVSIALRRYGKRVRADLLLVEHGVEPAIERECLDGGAELVRLPGRHNPELDPPVTGQPAEALERRDDGAA